MKATSKLIALGLASALAFGAAIPASAGSYSGHNDGGLKIQLVVKDKRHNAGAKHDRKQRLLGERQVRRILHREGYRDIKKVDFQRRNAAYVAYAEKRGGRDFRVTVSARNGRIIDVDRLDHRRGKGKDRRYDGGRKH